MVRVTVSSVAPPHRALIDEERASGGRAHPSIRSWTQDKGLARARRHERESKVVRNGRPKLTHGFMLSPKSSEIIRAIRRRLTRTIRPPQFAFVAFGQSISPDALNALDSVHDLSRGSPQDIIARLRSTELVPGGVLVARTHREPKNLDLHCEALLVSRLHMEQNPKRLEPLIFYSHRCPCSSCAARLAELRWDWRDLRMDLAWSISFNPPEYARYRMGLSDESSERLMREAGIGVGRLELAGSTA